MKTLIPSASACLIVAMVATVGYAETLVDQSASKKSADDTSHSKKEIELSVAPMDHVEYPNDRPDWVDKGTDFESPVHTWVVNTRPHETTRQCESELEVKKRAAVSLYIKELTGWVCEDDAFNQEWIDSELVGNTYVGDVVRGDEALKELAVELRFDQAARQKIRDTYRDAELGGRLRKTGGLFAIGLIALCCSGGLLGILSRRYG